jgi:hypothetical protein
MSSGLVCSAMSKQIIVKQFIDLLFNLDQNFVFDIDVHIDFDRFVRRLYLDRWRTGGNRKHQNYYHSKSVHYFTSGLFPTYTP